MSDLKIDFIDYDEEKLNKEKIDPQRVWINFYGRKSLFTEDIILLNMVVERFKNSRMLFLNLHENLKKELKLVVENHSNVEILDQWN